MRFRIFLPSDICFLSTSDCWVYEILPLVLHFPWTKRYLQLVQNHQSLVEGRAMVTRAMWPKERTTAEYEFGFSGTVWVLAKMPQTSYTVVPRTEMQSKPRMGRNPLGRTLLPMLTREQLNLPPSPPSQVRRTLCSPNVCLSMHSWP